MLLEIHRERFYKVNQFYPSPLPSDGSRLPVPRRDEADELLTIVAWLERNAGKVRVESLSGVLVEPLPRIRSYAPQGSSSAGRTTERTGVESGRPRRRRAGVGTRR